MSKYRIDDKFTSRYSGLEARVTDTCLAGDTVVYQLTWPDGSTGLWTETSILDEFKPKATFFETGMTYGHVPGGDVWFIDALKRVNGSRYAWATFYPINGPARMTILDESSFYSLKLMD